MIDIAPDFICEVLSDATEDIDRGRKKRIYARERVPHYWLVDPESRSLEIHALEGPKYVLVAEHHGDGPMRAPPFDEAAIDLTRLWAW